jgi:hypothetical protein
MDYLRTEQSILGISILGLCSDMGPSFALPIFPQNF